MLQMLHGYPHTTRTMSAVHLITTNLLEVRSTIVAKLAAEASSRDNRWTLQEWNEWIASEPFSRDTMNDVQRIWHDIYLLEMSQATQERIRGKPWKDVRAIERGNFRAWQKEKYGHAALAKVLVKYPLAKLHELLQEWQEYTQTPEYLEQRVKHAHRDQRPQAACTC